MSRHFEKCGRQAGPLKSSHFLFDLDKFQEIQLLTRNLSKAQTQQYLAEHLKTTVASMSSLHCFSWKDNKNSLFSRDRQIPSTTTVKNAGKKMPCYFFFPLSFFLLYLPIASSPASREHQMFSLSSYLLLYPTVLWQPTQTRCSRGTNKSLAHFGTYRHFISGVVLAVGRGPQFHYAVSPSEPAPFKTCYRNSRISPR